MKLRVPELLQFLVKGVYINRNPAGQEKAFCMKDLSVVPTFVTVPSCKTSETLTEHSDSQ
jgi:hypothetical protein